MDFKTIEDFDPKDKRVLVRVDFNVPFRNGVIEDDYRIVRTLPTLKYLVDRGAQVILLTHLSEDIPGAFLAISDYLKKVFETVIFIPGNNLSLAKGTIKTLVPGEIILLDNIRLFKGEEENDSVFAKELASLGDYYVNEAFSVSHRSHASIVGISKIISGFAGLLFEEEYKNLSQAFKPEHPFLLILGGVKFESKLGVLNKFVQIADKIFIGGGLANNFFKMLGEDVGNSVVDESVNVMPYIGNAKIFLPVDKRIKDGKILDIGPESIKFLAGLIERAQFILWNGPLGSYEEEGFDLGTKEVARMIAHCGSKIVIGGGNTIDVLEHMPEKKILESHAYLSTSGGAMLEFLANGTLPGIEALKD